MHIFLNYLDIYRRVEHHKQWVRAGYAMLFVSELQADACDIWGLSGCLDQLGEAHTQVLKEQGMFHRGYENKLYTKEAIEAGNKQS